MSSKAAKVYKFDKYVKEAKSDPFVLDTGSGPNGDGRISISPPSAETVMAVEEAGTSRRALSLLCGEQWDDVQMLLATAPGSALIGLVRDMTEHFGLSEDNVPPGGGRASSR